ncbi:MAG: NFACT family protein [Ktedonobacterales bacterium]
MQVDALTLAALAGELREALLGARVDDVIQPTPHAVALQFYGGGHNRWLMLSVHPQLARLHLLDRKPRKLTAEPPAFVMLLRKHLEGARLVELRQPDAERIIELGFRPRAEAEPVWLVVEVMGRLSNVILRDASGMILGALHQVSGAVNRYRAIVPNVAYRTPPPQTRTLHGETLPRLTADDVTGEALRAAAHEMQARPAPEAAVPAKGRTRKPATATVRTLLATTVAGFGPELAGEAEARAVGATATPLAAALNWDAARWDALAAVVQTLGTFGTLDAARTWEPTLVYADAEQTRPTAFAVYRPERFAGAELRPAASVNALLAAFYEDAEWRTALEGTKSELAHALRTHLERSRRKDALLRDELRGLEEASRLRVEADTLLAFQLEVPPAAAEWRVANPFSADEETLTVALDPRLTAVENATKKYERYAKLQRAGAQIPAQIAANTVELARIEQLRTDLDLAETPAEVALVRAELAEAGYLGRRPAAKPARKASKGGRYAKSKQVPQRRPEPGGAPLKRVSSDGFTLLVGKNSRQNETVTFGEGRSNDLWLHARGVPGAHVIVRTGGRPVPDATLREAAALAAYYSQSRAAGSVPVDTTEQRYVRHMKGGGPGMVTYERERTLHVAPDDVGAL